MARRTSPQDLIRLHKARERERKANARRPVHLRMTEDQIVDKTRRALDEGRINDYGIILKKE